MRIISVIQDQEVVKTILKQLCFWAIRSKPAAKAHAPPFCKYGEDGYSHTALPAPAIYDPWEAYITS